MNGDHNSHHDNEQQQVIPSLSESVGTLLMTVEELRLSLNKNGTIQDIMHYQHDLEQLLASLDTMARLAADHDDDTTTSTDLWHHCQHKAVTVAQQVLDTSTQIKEPNDTNNVDEQRRDGQAAVARIAEINLLLLQNNNNNNNNNTDSDGVKDTKDIIQVYVSYQRQILRQRAKSAIAKLVRERRNGINNNDQQKPPIELEGQHDDDDDDDREHTTEAIPVFEQHHAPVLTVILGQAAALIHPLLLWKMNLPTNVEDNMVHALRQLCTDSLAVLDEQAQSLTKTVSDWFWEDRPVEGWMQKSAHAEQQQGLNSQELGLLDGLVEEMAFGCQLQARYQTLINSSNEEQQQSSTSIIENELLPEWTWKYATLERFLAMQQWQSALNLATPVHIVMLSKIQVPSVVEDAQYLSTRALERAASTRSTQAIGTVAHAVSHDVWSTEMTGGVHQALLEQRGCWCEPKEDDKEKDKMEESLNKTKSQFASALLDALDEDLGESNASAKTPTVKSPSSGPRSGSFLRSFVGGSNMQEMQMDTQLCLLNGIHAAAGACRSLVNFLDALLTPDDDDEGTAQHDDKATAMIQLAREELFRYAEAYQQLLNERIKEALTTWCGSGNAESTTRNLCFDELRSFFEREEYQLDSTTINAAEADERLEHEMIGSLEESRFLQELSDRCESDVLNQVGKEVISVVVELIIDVLWTNEKKMTDWGSLLLSKQVRMLQGFVSKVLSQQSADGAIAPTEPAVIQAWERLSQIVHVLQLEKPSDWAIYQSTSVLSPGELERTLSLRADFSNEAIQTVVSNASKAASTQT